MVNQVLVNWILENHKKGYSFEELREILIQNKNNPLDVDNAISAAVGEISGKPIGIKKNIIKGKSLHKRKTFNNKPFNNFRFQRPVHGSIIHKPINFSDNKSKKSNKKIWIIFFFGILIFIILIIGIFTLIPRNLSEEKVSNGVAFKLKENKNIKFNLDNQKHQITVDNIKEDLVTIIIQSEPIHLDLKVGDEKKINFNKDNYYDLLIRLNKIEKNIANLYLKKINEVICIENWNCTNWTKCINGSQERNCTDLNNCGTNLSIPSLSQSCIVTCKELWRCENWSECINGTKTRICRDWNDCGTTIAKPILTIDCCIENWTCSNWSDCIEGRQNRTCIDRNNCGSFEEKPNEQQNCEESECLLNISSSLITLVNGSNSSAYVENFKNSTKISWIISNESIISLNSTTGSHINIQSLQIGLTNLTVIDNNIGSECNITILVNVTL